MSITFGEYLKNLREGKEMSIRQLAMYSSVSHGYLSQVERGERGVPSPEILKKLAPYLKVTYEELMEAAGYLDEVASENASNKIASAISDDPELVEFWNELTKRDDLQLLFKQVKDLSPDTVKRIVKYIKMVEDEEAEEN